MVLTRISWSHGKAQNLMLGRSYYSPKRGIYLNGFTVQSKKLIKGSLICSKHKGMKKCLNFFVISMVFVISVFIKMNDFICFLKMVSL